ncbi:hypothetical protein N7495_007172 [Penicillium taxi]|uniref:uncharacterized protein n=1 Tax=Penicillium taxi TaxID=168475 RepID=UPI002544EB3D|nr:uncharacterized protein N7495_007172 [Penicillium taxi]KAJ5895481.1 hypothetical protein N7495_007172 [Penicillium taxi]
MSIVQENACGVNTQLDRLQQSIRPEKLLYTEEAPTHHLLRLQDVINTISVTSKTQSLLPADRLVELLSDPIFTNQLPTPGPANAQVSDYLWLVTAKAAIQTSGLLMHSLLDQTLQLHEETYYWNETLGSVWYSGLYAVQTSPVQLWNWIKDFRSEHSVQGSLQASLSRSIAARWGQFYQIARQSIHGKYPLQTTWSFPIRSCRSEIRQKRDFLLARKDIYASSLGLLMEEWHSFQEEKFTTTDSQSSRREWQEKVSRTVALTQTILDQMANQSTGMKFEQQVFTTVENDMESVQMQSSDAFHVQRPVELIQRLVLMLQQQLPEHGKSTTAFIRTNGRPSGVIRYWLPLSVAFLSSSASLRFLMRRQDEIIEWIMNIGATFIDFGVNWVVDPIHKLIGTIRHNDKSEIAIMSKNSLEADRASLERMVLDFVQDHPDSSQGNMTSEDTITITNAVKEGDLTPVLRAYERDLRSPFMGTVRGDLIRALLIQIQKTKVDVEIAISGINALLKSQELVFGFVGLTPGILVSYTALQWFFGLFGSRRGLQRGKKKHELRRGLRTVTRILSSASVSDGIISYRDSGRLICEAEALLQQVKAMLGSMQYQEFREDIQDLLDMQSGVEKQIRVVDRIRWTYFQ